MVDPSQLPEANHIKTTVETAVKVGIGAIITGFFVLVARLYRIYKTSQALEKKYVHVTDETIRKELWTQWAIAVERVKDLEDKVRVLSVENRQLKDMNRNCAQENGVLVVQIAELKEEIEKLKGAA